MAKDENDRGGDGGDETDSDERAIVGKASEQLGEPVLAAKGFNTFESGYNNPLFFMDWPRIYRANKRKKAQSLPATMVLAITADRVHLLQGSGLGKFWSVGPSLESWPRSSVRAETRVQKTRGVKVFTLHVDGRTDGRSETIEIETSTAKAEHSEHIEALLADPTAP